MGKYSSKLYHRGHDSHSNFVFGILTLTSVFFIVYGSLALLNRALRREQLEISESFVNYSDWAFKEQTLGNYKDLGLNLPTLEIDTKMPIHWWYRMNEYYWQALFNQSDNAKMQRD